MPCWQDVFDQLRCMARAGVWPKKLETAKGFRFLTEEGQALVLERDDGWMYSRQSSRSVSQTSPWAGHKVCVC